MFKEVTGTANIGTFRKMPYAEILFFKGKIPENQ
jgi:hypothetical protein